MQKTTSNKLTVSILIPFYNEEKTLEKVVLHVINQKIPDCEKEIILINDGSTDRSRMKLNALRLRYGKDNKPKILHHARNMGMGKALQTGIAQATGQIILFQDADCEYNPKDIPSLVSLFQNPWIQVVYGSRYMRNSNRGYFFYYSATRFFTWLINTAYGVHLTDAFTGYKVFKAEVLKQITSPYSDFAFNVDITTKILKKKIKIHEVPISYAPRSFSEGKKVSPWIGVKDFWIIVKNRLY